MAKFSVYLNRRVFVMHVTFSSSEITHDFIVHVTFSSNEIFPDVKYLVIFYFMSLLTISCHFICASDFRPNFLFTVLIRTGECFLEYIS